MHSVSVDIRGAKSGDFIMKELEEALLSKKNKRVPDLVDVHKLAVQTYSLRHSTLACREHFSLSLEAESRIEQQRKLSLLCRLCMLDIAGKVLEKFIRNAFTEPIRAGNLFQRQFGFKAGVSTIDIVMKAMDAVHRAESHSRLFRWMRLS